MSKPLSLPSRMAQSPSEEAARRAVLQALRSHVELAPPLFSHDVDDDAAIVFGRETVISESGYESGNDDALWHRGWDL